MAIFNFFSKRASINFYNLLIEHSKIVYETYKLLSEYLVADREEGRQLAEQIIFNEREADDLRRILIDKLNQTLITPIDREDLFGLSRGIDDIIDAAKHTVEEIHLFKIEPTHELRTMVKVLEKGSLEIYDALRNLRKYPNVAKEHAIRAKNTENEMNHIYLAALAKLFDDSANSAGYMLKMREVFRHLNRSSDRCDETANYILDIIVKTE